MPSVFIFLTSSIKLSALNLCFLFPMIDVDILHDLEKKVLLTMKDIGDGVTFNVILEKSDLGESEVNRAIEWLKGKELISIDEDLKQKFRLTELGNKCCDKGMPEKRFLTAVKTKKLNFSELKKEAELDNDEFNASIGFLKKEYMIKITEGKIEIMDEGIKRLNIPWSEDKLLPMLKEWIYYEELPLGLREPIPFLKDRGLIEEEIKTIKTIYLTEEGKKVLPKIKIENKIDMLTSKIILDKSWKDKKFRKYDISAPSAQINIGKKQPYLKFVDDLKQKLVGLGFQETKGPMVELGLFNNDLLYMPQDHPARDIHDIYFIKKEGGDLKDYKNILNKTEKVHEDGWETGSKGWNYKFNKKKSSDVLLRSHTTAVSIRNLINKDLKIPGKYFTIDRNYRPDVIDWSHLAEFDQIDGIILGDDMTFRHLLGVLKMFAVEVGGAGTFHNMKNSQKKI